MLSDCGIGCCDLVSGAAMCLTTRLGIGSLDFRGKVCCLMWDRLLYCDEWGSFLFNGSSWKLQLGLQWEGVLSDCGIGCCVVVSGAGFYLTTRLGIRSLDFRGRCAL